MAHRDIWAQLLICKQSTILEMLITEKLSGTNVRKHAKFGQTELNNVWKVRVLLIYIGFLTVTSLTENEIKAKHIK